MKIVVSKVGILLLLVTVVGLAVIVLIRFTDVCRLEAVTLNSDVVDDWETEYGLSPDKTIFDQPVDSLADELLSQKGIFKVDVGYRLPHTLELRINDFEPVCFVVDKHTGKLRGLNAQAWVVSLSESITDWEHPVLSNIGAGRLYDYCDDPRVNIIVPQLMQLRRSNADLYRLLEEIDFTSKEYLNVSLAGLPYRLQVSAEGLLHQIKDFVKFLEQFHPRLEGTRVLDMRFENMIIRKGETGRDG